MTNLRMFLIAPILVPILATAGCGEVAVTEPSPPPQDMFFDALSSHCGKAYAGQLVSEDLADADFADAEMVMHVRECSSGRIAIPFHVKIDGEWDRSRTWLITRDVELTEAGGSKTTAITLKHDHRHQDGEPDAVTFYGGTTAEEGTAGSQNFPVDDFSVDMFEREGLTASVTNVWTVEVNPADSADPIFAYQLQRTKEGGAPEDRFFRVEFDLSQEVEAPPTAWGWE